MRKQTTITIFAMLAAIGLTAYALRDNISEFVEQTIAEAKVEDIKKRSPRELDTCLRHIAECDYQEPCPDANQDFAEDKLDLPLEDILKVAMRTRDDTWNFSLNCSDLTQLKKEYPDATADQLRTAIQDGPSVYFLDYAKRHGVTTIEQFDELWRIFDDAQISQHHVMDHIANYPKTRNINPKEWPKIKEQVRGNITHYIELKRQDYSDEDIFKLSRMGITADEHSNLDDEIHISLYFNFGFKKVPQIEKIIKTHGSEFVPLVNKIYAKEKRRSKHRTDCEKKPDKRTFMQHILSNTTPETAVTTLSLLDTHWIDTGFLPFYNQCPAPIIALEIIDQYSEAGLGCQPSVVQKLHDEGLTGTLATKYFRFGVQKPKHMRKLYARGIDETRLDTLEEWAFIDPEKKPGFGKILTANDTYEKNRAILEPQS
ncbi:hypothetical protein HN587_03250 [Candidatus Woesearchaeota archaeon]|jgi:hypothetical protein|nr:hypothetical protein [Candidatus Woesearchaeota archaeon]